MLLIQYAEPGNTVGGPFGPHHGTACTFAYFKEYAKTHAFSDEAEAKEEPLFTNGFTVPMEQLEPKDGSYYLMRKDFLGYRHRLEDRGIPRPLLYDRANPKRSWSL